MRKLVFKLGIGATHFLCSFQTLISWSGKQILCYFSQKKITNSKTPSEFKLNKEFFSLSNFKNIKMSIFQNHFSPQV